MQTPITLLVAASMMVLATACTTTTGGAEPTTRAQRADLAYCQRLVTQYTTYVGSVGGTLGGNSDRGAPADLDAKVAIGQCQEGNTGPAIPVLEQKLRDAKVAVPPRPS
jgi:hypothetical protein